VNQFNLRRPAKKIGRVGANPPGTTTVCRLSYGAGRSGAPVPVDRLRPRYASYTVGVDLIRLASTANPERNEA
jgi:hypothetical protein